MPDPAPPLLVKIAPDMTQEDLADVAAVATGRGLAGIIVSNTTVARPATLRGAARGDAASAWGSIDTTEAPPVDARCASGQRPCRETHVIAPVCPSASSRASASIAVSPVPSTSTSTSPCDVHVTRSIPSP
jgi:hypothetical protein